MKIFDPQLTGSIEVENPISGSVTTLGNVIALGSDSSLTGSFTGSFKGDGSALVGVIVDSGSWDGIFTGSAAISGSLNISGAEAIQLTVEKRIRGQYYSVYNSTAATYAGYLITSGDFEDDATTDLGLASGTGRNIRFYTANNPVEKMRLTTDGNLGIGIAPSSTTSLHIYKSDPILLIQASNTSGDAELQFFPRDGSNVAHLQSIKGNGSNLVFSTGGNSGNSYVPTEALTISSTGLTQINSTSTTALELITNQSASSLRLKNTGSIVADWIMQSGGITAGDLAFYNLDTSAYRLTITSGGQVIVGGTSYSGISGVDGGFEIEGNSAQFLLNNPSFNHFTIYSAADSNIYNIFGSSGDYLIGTGNKDTSSFSEKMRISSGGDVTIGSANDPYLYMISSGGNGYNQRFRMYGYADGGGAGYGGGFKIDTRNSSNVFNNALTISSGGAATFSNDVTVSKSGDSGININNTANNGLGILRYQNEGSNLWGAGINITNTDDRWEVYNFGLNYSPLIISSGGTTTASRGDAGTLIQASSSSGAGSGIINFFSSLTSSANNTNCSHFQGTTQGINSWRLYGNGSSSWTSDSRLKRDIETTRDGYIDDVKQLRVVKYKWKNDPNSSLELGLIAQEVETIFPSLVVEDKNSVGDEVLYNEDDKIPNGKKVGDVKIEGTTYKSVKYSVLPMILLKAIQEQQTQIEELKSEIQLLKNN